MKWILIVLVTLSVFITGCSEACSQYKGCDPECDMDNNLITYGCDDVTFDCFELGRRPCNFYSYCDGDVLVLQECEDGECVDGHRVNCSETGRYCSRDIHKGAECLGETKSDLGGIV